MYIQCRNKRREHLKIRIHKWGNSLALRIPKSFALEAGLAQDSPVDISLREGQLILTPETNKKFSFQSLLSRVTDKNIHGEIETGASVGREEW